MNIYIYILITLVIFVAAYLMGCSANRMGDGGLGLGMLALLIAAVPVLGWVFYLILLAVQHVRWS